jgi:sigma-B regulation protein RsbU (phosphoserine phosphatase)
LASILDFEQLLRVAGERIRRLVNYDMFAVMLLNQETQRLENVFALRYDERIHPNTILALGEGLCGTAALQRAPIRVNAVEFDARYIQCAAGLGVQSELVVPLIAKDRLLGVLDLESLQRDAFTEGHELMLLTLAPSLAVALENARLYDELKQAEQRMARDLERARQVQQALLPAEKPNIRGLDIATRYLPALELGGDFYDFLPYGSDRLAIAVGDVAGKGSAAALLASLGIGLLREHASQHPCAPEEMLAEINRHLHLASPDGQFVALAFAVYDASTRELCLANAGFPPPLLVRDGSAAPLAARGVPLGLFPASTYEPLRLQLRDGDVVVFCSDGIHEQTNSIGEEFGLARLMSHLASTKNCDSVDRIAGDILDATLFHAGERAACDECKDDRTIVVLGVREDGRHAK